MNNIEIHKVDKEKVGEILRKHIKELGLSRLKKEFDETELKLRNDLMNDVIDLEEYEKKCDSYRDQLHDLTIEIKNRTIQELQEITGLSQNEVSKKYGEQIFHYFHMVNWKNGDVGQIDKRFIR